jgi:hypothetical protein
MLKSSLSNTASMAQLTMELELEPRITPQRSGSRVSNMRQREYSYNASGHVQDAFQSGTNPES